MAGTAGSRRRSLGRRVRPRVVHDEPLRGEGDDGCQSFSRPHHGWCGGQSPPLQTDHIDLYQIHGSDSVTPVEETLCALDTLVRQGKVRYISCSNWQAWKIAKVLGICEFRNLARLDTLQAYYSIAGRDLEREILPLLESERVGLLVWSPLAGGLLSGKYSRTHRRPADSRRINYDFPIVDKERTWKILDVLAPIARAHGCSPARLSIANGARRRPKRPSRPTDAAASRGNVVLFSGVGNHSGSREPMAIAGAGRSRATESDGGQARRAEGLQLTRANGDCGVDGVNSVGNRSLNEPRGWSWFRGDWCGCATA
jgi:hypothetical protein